MCELKEVLFGPEDVRQNYTFLSGLFQFILRILISGKLLGRADLPNEWHGLFLCAKIS